MKTAVIEKSDGFHVTYDGREDWHAHETEGQALDDMFAGFAWPGGYPVAWFGDGVTLCAECARNAWEDPDNCDHDAIRAGEIESDIIYEPSSLGETCDNCEQYIPGCEPHCAECVTELDSDRFHFPLFVRDSGDAQICAHCMAEYVVKGEATKTGKLMYDLPLNGPWYGGGTYRA